MMQNLIYSLIYDMKLKLFFLNNDINRKYKMNSKIENTLFKNLDLI